MPRQFNELDCIELLCIGVELHIRLCATKKSLSLGGLISRDPDDLNKHKKNLQKAKERAQPGIEPGTSCKSEKPKAGIIPLDH